MTAYQKYQLQWMIDHDHSLEEMMSEMLATSRDGFDGDVVDLFNEWEFSHGFGGEIWACLGEWEDCEEKNINELWDAIIEKLPSSPPAKGLEDECPIWTDGTEILCRTEWLAYTIANILDNIAGDRVSHYHFYDPEEDERSGEVDSHTGWWYVDFD